MTVAELIVLLQRHPHDMLVVVGGFDDVGYADVEADLGPVEIQRLIVPDGYAAYENPGKVYSNKCVTEGPVIEALYLG